MRESNVSWTLRVTFKLSWCLVFRSSTIKDRNSWNFVKISYRSSLVLFYDSNKITWHKIYQSSWLHYIMFLLDLTHCLTIVELEDIIRGWKANLPELKSGFVFLRSLLHEYNTKLKISLICLVKLPTHIF